MIYISVNLNQNIIKLLMMFIRINFIIYYKIRLLHTSFELFPTFNRIRYISTFIHINDPDNFTAVVAHQEKRTRYYQQFRYKYFSENKHRYFQPDKDSKVIIIIYKEYDDSWFNNLGFSDLGGFLGGTEEVLLSFSRGLADEGYWVEIYTEIKASSYGICYKSNNNNGILLMYNIDDIIMPIENYKNVICIISYRNTYGIHLIEKKNENIMTFVWLHDLPIEFNWYSDINFFDKKLDKVIVVSNYHKSTLTPYYQSKVYIIIIILL